MIDFWIAATPLLLLASACILIPVWRSKVSQTTHSDRTALNVELYQERLATLSAQQAAGVLSGAQWEQARTEAARELLADTDAVAATAVSNSAFKPLGKGLLVLLAILIPLAAVYLYQHWGSQAKLALTREMATPPANADELIDRLQRATQLQPEAGGIWYSLGRAYMDQDKPVQATAAFERAIQVTGRQPELLGQWLQARYFSPGRTWSEEMQQTAEEVLRADPKELTTLGLLGAVAFEAKRFQDAVYFWTRMEVLLPEQNPSRAAILGGIARAKAELQHQSSTGGAQTVGIRVTVDVTPEVRAQAKPEDSVFIFAKASGAQLPMPMPLAVKRLTLADLPAEVVLSDADAMLPQLRLSGFEKVILVARISRSGNALQGDWAVETSELSLNKGSKLTQHLLIEQSRAASN
ncbi:cytochrome c-type biogenesis protein CcmH [Azomonas agilis]|uniref:Cytochrome c-type biogenesis protein CcmH n=1 Tax=Azomonas agilis TaxID=116849 RepID=A0A562I1J5_9GAMM|nr:c-type cytochrome biogenesis protein CcmI [Azomonas agilis]TWH64919.1 cytochrome c-type biogenesis protein CcmH [Azomonas agilis]